jgi:hypothetical protein
MPKGVEHLLFTAAGPFLRAVISAVMPKGVEHQVITSRRHRASM